MKHGGDLGEAASLHGCGSPWLDLSTGINPHPWPVPPELALAGWTSLPARADLHALITAARVAYAVPERLAVVPAPGAQAIIQWLPRLAPPGRVAVIGPTYGGHEEAWRCGGFDVDVRTDAQAIGSDVRHVVVVNPNNPDGRVLPVAELLDLAARCNARGGWLVVDESFADADPTSSIVPVLTDAPIVALRSFGKFFGLPGIRLGFAIAPEPMAVLLRAALGDWAVSAPALRTGVLALSDRTWIDGMRQQLAREIDLLDAVLTESGLELAGGTSLFRLVRRPKAGEVHHSLARSGIWTRRFDWADDLLRIGLPPNDASRARLAVALREACR